jgi:arylsulfatase A-like enzyme
MERMRRWPTATSILLLAAVVSLACRSAGSRGPLRLIEQRTADGGAPRLAPLSTGGETRPALLESARFTVPLARRALLTFAAGLDWQGEGEAPGWFRLTVRAGDRVIEDRRWNPRTFRGFHDLSYPLEGGGPAMLDFQIRFTDRHGRDVTRPPGLLLGVADPVVHDLDDYGRAQGVVLISIDTLRRDHVGAYGYPRPTTPRIDALARQGVLAEDAVSTSSWTLPAHLSMLTSVDPSVHGGVDMKHGFNRRVPALPALLRDAGFAAHAVTSHLYVSSVYGLDHGFDHLDFRQDRKAGDVANHAIDLLDRLGDRPFFLFLHFYDPHWHYQPPAGALAHFAKPYGGTITGRWQDLSQRTRETTSAADLDHLLALYDGEIRYTDDEIGRVLDHLKIRGLDRRTLVVVTSDHGEEFLDHGSWEHQKTLYEEVVRVPLLVAGPGVAPRREPAQTSLLDVAPTILAWAGLPQPAEWQGTNLLRAVPPREAYGETDHTVDGTHKLFLRAGAGRWKAIFSLAPDAASLRHEEWYDLAADPGETRSAPPRDASADAVRQRALERFRQGRDRGAGAPAVQLTPEQREQLRALGYVGR